MEQNETKWNKIKQNETKWNKMEQNKTKWNKMESKNENNKAKNIRSPVSLTRNI